MASYARMDHAKWAQNQAPRDLTPFEKRVFDILGIAYGGIYNAPIYWASIDWSQKLNYLHIPVDARQNLATFDSDRLTKLVFLSHEARMRFCLKTHGPRGFMLSFWQRQKAEGINDRHPNLAEAVAEFRRWMPPDHRINFDAAAQPEIAAEATP